MNCKKVFLDDWIIYNTRTDKVLSNCPFCMCMHTINASVFLEKYDKKMRDNGHPIGRKSRFDLSMDFYYQLKKKVEDYEME